MTTAMCKNDNMDRSTSGRLQSKNRDNKKPKRAKNTVGDGKEHKKNWKEYTATVEDIQNFLMDRVRALQIVGGNMVHQISPVRLGRAFTDLGFEFKRTKSSRGYIVVQRTAAEIKSRLQMMAGDG
jgi:hypothetical protein